MKCHICGGACEATHSYKEWYFCDSCWDNLLTAKKESHRRLTTSRSSILKPEREIINDLRRKAK